MKRLVALALGLIAVAAATTPAAAWGAGTPQVSVFPTYRDPWASWGRRPHTAVVVPAPGAVVVGPGAPVVTQPYWISGQWAWNGYYWVWVPGHWGF